MRQFGVVLTLTAMFLCAIAAPARADLDPDGEVITLPDSIDTNDVIELRIDGRDITVDLRPHSVRAHGFRVLTDDGVEVKTLKTGGARTVRGEIVGEPGSMLAGAVGPAGLTAMIWTNGQTWEIEPEPGNGNDNGLAHRVRPAQDGLPGQCGAEDGGRFDLSGLNHSFRPRHRRAMPAGGTILEAEVAIEADFPLFQARGQSESATTAYIEEIMNAVSAIYERDIGFRYTITAIIIRTSSAADPYTTTDGGDLLGQFRSNWLSTQGGIQRDIAHLFSGRNFNGGTLGVAWVSSGCGNFGFGVNEVTCCGFSGRVALVSHEMGHNWGAGHCNSDSVCRIMCSGLGGCSGLGSPVQFASGSIGRIQNYIGSVNCLDGFTNPLPLVERFEAGQFNDDTWDSTNGVTVAGDPFAPSLFWSGSIANNGALVTVPFDSSQGSPVVDLYARADQLLAGSELLIEFFSQEDRWERIAGLPVTGREDGFLRSMFQLPDGARYASASLRIRSFFGSGGNWAVDNIAIESQAPELPNLELPVATGFDEGALDLITWDPATGLPDVVQSVAGTPSPPYTLQIDPAQSALSRPIMAGGLDGDQSLAVQFSARRSGDGVLPGSVIVFYVPTEGAEPVVVEVLPLSDSAFEELEVVLPEAAAVDGVAVRLSPTLERIFVDDLTITAIDSGCGLADIAQPFGTLDIDDILLFLNAFSGGDPLADTAPPAGVFDIDDVLTFLGAFAAGCGS